MYILYTYIYNAIVVIGYINIYTFYIMTKFLIHNVIHNVVIYTFLTNTVLSSEYL